MFTQQRCHHKQKWVFSHFEKSSVFTRDGVKKIITENKVARMSDY